MFCYQVKEDNSCQRDLTEKEKMRVNWNDLPVFHPFHTQAQIKKTIEVLSENSKVSFIKTDYNPSQ